MYQVNKHEYFNSSMIEQFTIQLQPTFIEPLLCTRHFTKNCSYTVSLHYHSDLTMLVLLLVPLCRQENLASESNFPEVTQLVSGRGRTGKTRQPRGLTPSSKVNVWEEVCLGLDLMSTNYYLQDLFKLINLFGFGFL